MLCVEETRKKSKTSRSRAIFRGGSSVAQKIQRGATNESCKARKSSGNIWCYFLGKVKTAIFTVKNAFLVKGGQTCPVRLFLFVAKIQRGAKNESCKARKSSGNIWCYFLGKTKNAIFTVKTRFRLRGVKNVTCDFFSLQNKG